jgi:hypothetical protein
MAADTKRPNLQAASARRHSLHGKVRRLGCHHNNTLITYSTAKHRKNHRVNLMKEGGA